MTDASYLHPRAKTPRDRLAKVIAGRAERMARNRCTPPKPIVAVTRERLDQNRWNDRRRMTISLARVAGFFEEE